MKKQYFVKYICLLLLLILSAYPGLAQQKAFTGTLNDENGRAIANAMVTVREQPGLRVFTDNEGKFSITGETGQLLEVTTRDQRFRSQRLDSDQFIITMSPDNMLVPTGFGIERRNEELSSAIGIAGSDELIKSSVINPADALYGRIPGLTVLQNGGINMSNDPDMYIRGIGTFGITSYNNRSMLTIVDGIERPISSLSLNEIESVAVLKDAASQAMYGIRGANGVLLVTTKKGTGKGLSIDVTYDHGITKAFRLPEFLDAYGYASAVNQARLNDGLTKLYSDPELDRYQSGSSPYLYPDVDWIDEGLRDYGSTNKFSISLQEQAKAVRYYLLLNYDNESGLLGPVTESSNKSTQVVFDKINFRSNIDVDLFRSTKLNIKLAGNFGETSRPSTSSENGFISSIYDTPSSAHPVNTYNPSNLVKKYWGGTSTFNMNPVALINNIGYTLRGRNELMVDLFIEQGLDKLLKGLTARVGASFNKSFDYLDARTNTFKYEQLTPVLDPVTFDVVDTISTIYGVQSATSFATSVPSSWMQSTIVADLKHVINWGDNELSSVLLFQREELVKINRFNTFRHLLLAGNVHYAKAGKYFADLSLSYSGTSVLPENKRFGFFPALSLAWKLSNEEFLKGSTLINNLKLRASWGIVGSDQLIQNIYESAWTGGTGYYFTNNNTSFGGNIEGQLAASPLTFESSAKTNIGIDAGLFKVLDLTLDVFYDKRTGILTDSRGRTSQSFGVTPPYSSSGIVSNKGIDLGINLHQSAGDFSYHLGGQLSYTKNEIIEMQETYRPEEYLKRTGQSVGQAFGLEAIGFFADEADIAASPKQAFSILRPGDIKYKDQNNDGEINDYDQVPVGYSSLIPNLYYSVSLGVKFKGVGIEALVQGITNQTVYLNTPSIFLPLRSNTNISTFSEGAWTPETASTATLPRLSMTENLNNYRGNTIWLVDGSYLKLRSVELYYDFSDQVLSKIKLKNARLYLRGMNLFSSDKIKFVDPEEIRSVYPTTSSYHVGVRIGF